MNTTLQNLLAESFTNYQGCIIEKTKCGFVALGKTHATIEEAKKFIDNAFKASFRNINGKIQSL